MDENHQKHKENEKEIELDRNSNHELKIKTEMIPEIFETNQIIINEHFASNHNDNNEEIIIVQDDSNVHVKENQVKRDNIIFEAKLEVAKKNQPQDNNISIQPHNNLRSSEQKPFSKQPKAKFFFEDIYKDILFFFINPISGSHYGQLLIDMGVKKVEFLDIVHSSSACSAYIFNILDQSNYVQGIALLKDYQERGKLLCLNSAALPTKSDNWRR